METKRRLSRRDFLKIGAMSGAGLVLASCAPQGESALRHTIINNL